MVGLKFLKEEMGKIKENENSFLGMDGGKISSNIWVCGVEFGSDVELMAKYYNTFVKYYEERGLKVPYRKDCPKIFLKSTYDRFLAVMYICLFKEEEIKLPLDAERIEKVLKKELYNENSEIFKMNLFPLAKKDVSWNADIENIFGISKEIYYGSFFNNRMGFIKQIIQKFEPKLIICTSPKDYKDYFVEAFLGNNEIINYSWDYLVINEDKKFKISLYDNGKTKVVIAPFLGRGNLSSHYEVALMAKYLRKKYPDSFINLI